VLRAEYHAPHRRARKYHPRVPELPDITVYIDALRPRILNQVIQKISIRGPFLLRTVDPPIESAESRNVTDISRLGSESFSTSSRISSLSSIS
jgi:hypothetical protein